MNPTTNQPIPQEHIDNARHSLGVVTNALQQMMPQGQTEQPQTPQNAPQEAKTPETAKEPMVAKMTEMELTFTKKLDEIKQELKDSQKMEMEAIKNNIQKALEQENADEKS